MKNIFDEPDTYINVINKISVPEKERKQFTGKSIAVVWLTKFCQANCRHCFNRSNMLRNSNIDELFQLSERGINKLLTFVEKARVSYILLSGGGEPMRNPNMVNRIVRFAKAERIVIVTNGSWAAKRDDAERCIRELYNSYKEREQNAEVVLRLSTDEYHLASIGQQAYLNIINIFREQYSSEDSFTLMLHILQDDRTVIQLAECLGGSFTVSEKSNISDNNIVTKIMPGYGILKLDSYSILVGIARLFYPNLFVDLEDDTGQLEKALSVFDVDMAISELDNPAITKNHDGSFGLDFWIDYNGNITTWGNQLSDDLMNIYVDSCEKILESTQKNIYSYNLLDKGFSYRSNIIGHVNQKAVLRAKAINLRNYTNIYLLFEKRTKLYLGIRILKDYLHERKINDGDIRIWSENLADFVNLKLKEIDNYYQRSSYDIISQYLAAKELLHQSDWDILFALLKKNQFDYSGERLQTAFEWYRIQYGRKIESLDEYADVSESHEFYDNAKQKLFPVKEEALDYFKNYQENRGMVLSDKDIKRYMQKGRLIITARYQKYPFEIAQVQPGSLDLRLGNRIRSSRKDITCFDTKNLQESKAYHWERIFNEGAPIILQPHQIVIGETYEFLTLPGDLTAILTGRSRYVRVGIAVYPMFINPGFSGPVPIQIQNNNEFEVILYPFADICQVVFYKLSQLPERDYLQRTYKPWRENYYESYPGGIAQEEGEELSVQEKRRIQEQMKEAYYGNIQKVKQQESIQNTFKEHEVMEKENTGIFRNRKVLTDVGVSRVYDFPKEGKKSADIDTVINEIDRMKEYIKEEYTPLDYNWLTKELTLAEELGRKGDMEKVKAMLVQGGRHIGDIAKIIGCPFILKCLEKRKL